MLSSKTVSLNDASLLRLYSFQYCKLVLGSELTESDVLVSAVYVTVSNILSVWFSADGTIDSISGSAMAKDPSEPAKLLVSFFEGKNP